MKNLKTNYKFKILLKIYNCVFISIYATHTLHILLHQFDVTQREKTPLQS